MVTIIFREPHNLNVAQEFHGSQMAVHGFQMQTRGVQSIGHKQHMHVLHCECHRQGNRQIHREGLTAPSRCYYDPHLAAHGLEDATHLVSDPWVGKLWIVRNHLWRGQMQESQDFVDVAVRLTANEPPKHTQQKALEVSPLERFQAPPLGVQ